MKRRLERIPNFITKEEQEELIAWIEKGLENKSLVAGMSRGDYGYQFRKTTRLNKKKVNFPKVAYAIQQRILDSFNWTTKCQIEPILNAGQECGMIAVATFDGGDTYKHRDPKLSPGKSATRFNIILQKPESGGELYVEGENCACDERELHCYNVTDSTHWVTEVHGDTPRYIWIFGMNVPHSEWESGQIYKKT